MSLDLDRITHPLRLARGSHEPGSGKGCAMNAIRRVAALCVRAANGDAPSVTEWREARAYAYAAAAADAAADAAAAARVAYTRRAIARWRELAGLDRASDIDTAAVDSAIDKIGV